MGNKRMGVMAIMLSLIAIAGSVMYSSKLQVQTDALLASLSQSPVQTEWTHAIDRDFKSELEAVSLAEQEVVSCLTKYQQYVVQGTVDDTTIAERQAVLAQMRNMFESGASLPGTWYSSVDTSLEWSWQAEKNYEFTANGVKALWTCRDQENHVLAYAQAEYHFANRLFTKPVIRTTMYGNGRVPVTGLPDDSYNPDKSEEIQQSVDSILDMASQVQVAPNEEITDDELTIMGENNQAKDKLFDQWMNQGGADHDK